MRIKRLTRLKDSTYEVEIEDKVYRLEESLVLKYRLFKDYEISKEDFLECIQSNDLETIKKKAYSYYIRYQKNSYEIIAYLTEREISYSLAQRAVHLLEEESLICDLNLAKLVASFLARNSNGILEIRYKLKNRHFKPQDIEEALATLPLEDIEEGKSRLYAKALKKYNKCSTFEQKQKIKELFYRHGYIDGVSS